MGHWNRSSSRGIPRLEFLRRSRSRCCPPSTSDLQRVRIPSCWFGRWSCSSRSWPCSRSLSHTTSARSSPATTSMFHGWMQENASGRSPSLGSPRFAYSRGWRRRRCITRASGSSRQIGAYTVTRCRFRRFPVRTRPCRRSRCFKRQAKRVPAFRSLGTPSLSRAASAPRPRQSATVGFSPLDKCAPYCHHGGAYQRGVCRKLDASAEAGESLNG